MSVWQFSYLVVKLFQSVRGCHLLGWNTPSSYFANVFVCRTIWFWCSWGCGVLCFALCMPTLVSTCVGFNRSAYKCRSSSLTLISTYFGYWLVWGFPLMSLSHDMVRLPRVEKVAWFWRGGWGSETGVPLFPISYQYLNCLFQAWDDTGLEGMVQ